MQTIVDRVESFPYELCPNKERVIVIAHNFQRASIGNCDARRKGARKRLSKLRAAYS